MGWRVTSWRGTEEGSAAPALSPAPSPEGLPAAPAQVTSPVALAASARELAVAAERLAGTLDAVDVATWRVGGLNADVDDRLAVPPEPVGEPIEVRPGRARMRDSPLADLFRATT